MLGGSGDDASVFEVPGVSVHDFVPNRFAGEDVLSLSRSPGTSGGRLGIVVDVNGPPRVGSLADAAPTERRGGVCGRLC